MFSIQHIIWMAICIILVVYISLRLRKTKPELRKVLSVMCIVCCISEFIKVFSSIHIVPSLDGTMYYPYMELSQLPLNLCSMQIILIFYVRFAKDSKIRDAILAFMYPTCLGGAFFAILIPSVLTVSIAPELAFLRPIGYQYFLFHTGLAVLGIYIPMCHEVKLEGKHYFMSMGILLGIAFISLYINSIFAAPVYENGELIAVEYTTNFILTYQTPIGLNLTEIWQWYLYLVIIVSIAFVGMGCLYMPYLRRDYFHKEKIKRET